MVRANRTAGTRGLRFRRDGARREQGEIKQRFDHRISMLNRGGSDST